MFMFFIEPHFIFHATDFVPKPSAHGSEALSPLELILCAVTISNFLYCKPLVITNSH